MNMHREIGFKFMQSLCTHTANPAYKSSYLKQKIPKFVKYIFLHVCIIYSWEKITGFYSRWCRSKATWNLLSFGITHLCNLFQIQPPFHLSVTIKRCLFPTRQRERRHKGTWQGADALIFTKWWCNTDKVGYIHMHAWASTHTRGEQGKIRIYWNKSQHNSCK